MNKVICLSLFFVMTFTEIFSQDSLITRSSNQFIHTNFGFGYRRNNLGTLNDALRNLGYKSLNQNFSNFSLAVGISAKRFVLHSEASLFFSPDTDIDTDLKATVQGHSFAWAVGYSVIEKPKVRFYPYVGLHSAFSSLKAKDQTPIGDWNDLPAVSNRNFSLDFVSTSLDLGFQLERIIPLVNGRFDCPQNSGFATIGIRAGYLIGLGKGKGEYNEQKVNGAPSFAMQGPYVTLFIGFGTKLRRVDWKK